MTFKYFRDPDNFAFKMDKPSECILCNNVGLWFDTGGYYGINEIECICDECLIKGKLKELEIEANEAFEGNTEDKETIIYKTPALPTWQSREWPFINGEYCVFERIASKEDFDGKEDFQSSFTESDRESSDLDLLWSGLQKTQITNHREENFNASVYLFTSNGKKHCIWDSN